MRPGLVLVLAVAILAVGLAPTPASAQGWPSSLFRSISAFTDNARSNLAKAVENVKNSTATFVEDAVRFAVARTTRDEVCFFIVGCFSLKSPWVSLSRPVPAPKEPDAISVRFYYYSRQHPERYTVLSGPDMNLADSGFDAAKPTYFLVHGYLNSGNETWMAELKDAVLKNVDGNVFIVDWGNGATEANYLQAVANTRVVGREIGLLGRNLIRYFGASARDFHFMGHSLGAHISGYAARNITSVGRVTAFDPAGPGFEALPRLVRLNKYSARFVDVLHTNAKPVTLLGFGMMHAIGHIDFYLNGGVDQPGCSTPNVTMPKSILDVVTIPVNALSELISCSHSRSYEYFTEALNNTDCRMWGHKTSVTRQRLLWRKSVPSPVPDKTGKCERGRCVPIGLDTPSFPARGAFSVVTSSAKPFCIEENSNDGQTLQELQSLGLVG
ncbi:Pancreatic triacylglycerol lipase [Frankliniella fusca]|uniref:Pancreatic triacylglycerol lipase n=1 Tax=Frankliniella fusca TaxID=407009 RepID=A0AAE1HRC5_9NEOP|nr:Pancreatic triacylglycerol lipase [Frankliniella fusca]